ncbi:MAG: hypothetical protein V3V01_09365 [Acidimicrobiales bacterium]
MSRPTSARMVAFFALAVLVAGCETVTETLIINETGSGSLIVEWSATEDRFDRSGFASEDIELVRQSLNEVVAEALGEDRYVLNDQVAFNAIRNGAEAGFSIVDPINNLDELAELNSDDISTGRPPAVLWRDIQLSIEDPEIIKLTAKPSVSDRRSLLAWGDASELPADEMVFLAVFEVRGQVVDHNADEIDGSRLIWRISGAEDRVLDVAWRPLAPESTSAFPFVVGLVGVIAMITVALYQWEKSNLDKTSSSG